MSATLVRARPAESQEDLQLLRRVRAERQRQSIHRLIDRVGLTLALLVAWELVVRAGLVGAFFISQPSLILADLYKLFATGFIYRHMAITLGEALAGLLAGTLLGMSVGFGAALSRRLADALQPLLVALNSMPRVAIAPMFIIWFGFGPESKVALTMAVVFFIVFFNTFSGARSVDPVLVNNVRAMGGSRMHVLRLVVIPFTAAWVFAAMNTSISMALIAAVVAEFVGATAGLGWIMVQASGVLDTTRLFSMMVVLAVIGALLFAGVRWLEERILGWRPSADY